MTYTHYTPIDRHTGQITKLSHGMRALGTRPIGRIPGATTSASVVSVEPGEIAGWGTATAIGMVEVLVDGIADRPAMLALLHDA